MTHEGTGLVPSGSFRIGSVVVPVISPAGAAAVT